MTWRDVLDGNKQPAGSNVKNAIDICIHARYKFLAWNDRIYHIIDNGINAAEAVDTGLLVEDIK